ncbi:MAG TPA: hypothetical protein VFP65_17095 [Anaeromyxobacteraceae bacterium]|nr:hypothetical protein [Anaeromyxobacteraceae bacterium]
MTPSLTRLPALALAVALAAPAAGADRFPTRGGESGLLDVPDADTAPRGAGRIGLELGYAKPRGGPGDVAPLPLSLVTGFADRLEVGFALRQGGMPGDPQPSPTLFTGALKLRLADDTGWWPAFALDLYADRFTDGGVLGSRLIASTPQIGRVRLAGYAGVEGHGPNPPTVGPTAGFAMETAIRRDMETVLEAVAGPRGPMVGGALRFGVFKNSGFSVGASWLPKDGGMRFSLGFAISSAPPKARRTLLAPEAPKAKAAEAPRKPEEPVFADARPKFRLRVNSVTSPADAPRRHLQYAMAPEALRTLAKAGPRKGPTPEQARARELEAQADALDQREKRLHSAVGALAQRRERLAVEGQRLEAREKLLEGRGAALDARELKIPAAGKPTERELQLAALEDALRGTERELRLEEKSATEAGAANAARERAAESREDAARAAALEAASSAPAPDDLSPDALSRRAKALQAREAHLTAVEAHVAATREQLEAVERVVRARADRLEALEKRLSAKEERLSLVEGRARARSASNDPGAAGGATAGARP